MHAKFDAILVKNVFSPDCRAFSVSILALFFWKIYALIGVNKCWLKTYFKKLLFFSRSGEAGELWLSGSNTSRTMHEVATV